MDYFDRDIKSNVQWFMEVKKDLAEMNTPWEGYGTWILFGRGFRNSDVVMRKEEREKTEWDCLDRREEERI